MALLHHFSLWLCVRAVHSFFPSLLALTSFSGWWVWWCCCWCCNEPNGRWGSLLRSIALNELHGFPWGRLCSQPCVSLGPHRKGSWGGLWILCSENVLYLEVARLWWAFVSRRHLVWGVIAENFYRYKFSLRCMMHKKRHPTMHYKKADTPFMF